ncbi:MAG TPA: LCP family protein [Acidimicrobiia bacterium]|jgi:LCP family protein required for cell wall assembly|nr:LCP family protein [Acidimicrobiia bacterium]
MKTKQRRHWAVRVARAAGIGAATVMLACTGLVALWLHGVRLPLAAGKPLIKVQKFASASYQGEPSGVVFILLIGSDLRPGVGGSRGDALHVLAVNTTLKKGTIVNIPRDTCSDIPNHGTTKINAANAYGGPALQAEVINQMLGIHLTYSVLVDFAGFGALVNGVGGLNIVPATTMNDHDSGAYFTGGVPYHVDGGGALAYSRDRHDFARGDIERTANQATLVLDAMAQLRARAATPAGAFHLLAMLGQNATLTGIGLSDLYRLGRLAQSVSPANIRNFTIPVGGGGCLPLLAGASSAFQDFADDGVLESH